MALHTNGPRIRPGRLRDIGLVNAAIAGVLGVATGGQPPNIFTTLGRHRRLFRQWLFFAGGLMPGGSLPRRETELLILHVANHMRCDYEWYHHQKLGKRAGVRPEEMARLRAGDIDAIAFSARDRAMLRAATEFMDQAAIGDEAWHALAEHLDEPKIIEFCLLVGHYQMLAKTLNSMGVEPDGAV